MTGHICDVPLPRNVTPLRPPTFDDLEAEGERLGLWVDLSANPLHGLWTSSAYDVRAQKFVVRVEDSCRAGVLAKAVGELRQL